MPTSDATVVGRRANEAWSLEDAKAHFSEVVRRARTGGPQHVKVRGKPAVVVISIKELEALLPHDPVKQPLLEFLQRLHVESFELERERDHGRDIAL